ncbi:hypothetical protein [Pseudomonas fluorescens]|uniref:hypothetical protein n=1 Tax=Pseudomonas fluorescens TaxID=294 RepID=UPI001BE603BD|nr:hypothetical protein [Pseudomonas fluorescens]MBT2373246.1 hypothetical protein [Pseudomonas fluorescens]
MQKLTTETAGKVLKRWQRKLTETAEKSWLYGGAYWHLFLEKTVQTKHDFLNEMRMYRFQQVTKTIRQTPKTKKAP